MGVADFQNPIANMPHVQQLQVSHQQQAQAAPGAQVKTLEAEVRQELTTVQPSEDQTENARVTDQDSSRGGAGRKPPRPRMAIRREPSVPEPGPEKRKRPQDGIHGRFLDTEA